ncbi:putative EA22-like protein [Escherichia coli]|uniref:ead/Ea22-like family protein n=1 Tax=Escherichia coli TaxID=562 RepID=UPI000BE14A82|nr:ead/Ea22-like family protein [Escherichia coli]EJH1759584.1 ead/Ea22-like family protein [Escherichia coli]UMT13021.1 hypothetical protein AOY61_09645 [Escherichia coli]CAD5625008.1 putative EA22-like protein [Escherichia coli]CAD5876267.1 putative EA22-like protein [Escherichia coli]CAD6100166.1 putative EA22-like protein [Escherichia coli]
MKFSKFSELVNRILSNNHIHRRDMDVTIVVHSPGSIGSTPSVEVQSIHAGFDWDSGKVLIFPAQPLTTLTPEQITDITDSVRKGQSWHAYQEYRKHKEQLDKLSNELEAAKSKLNKQREYYEGVIADGSKRIAELETREIKPAKGEVLVVVSGFTGCGKSAIAGEIEIAMKAIGVPVTWTNGDAEKRMTGSDWLTAIEMYKPTVRIVEVNVPRAAGIRIKGE